MASDENIIKTTKFCGSDTAVICDCGGSHPVSRLFKDTPSKVWDGIIYPFLNFNGCTVEV